MRGTEKTVGSEPVSRVAGVLALFLCALAAGPAWSLTGDDLTSTVFTAPETRIIELSKGGILRDAPFIAVERRDGWDRPWKFKVSFSYRTLGVKGKAVALVTRGLKEDGTPANQPLWPSTYTGRREDTYLLSESEDFRAVEVEVNIPSVIRPNYRFEWERRFGSKGKVEVRDFKVELVRRPIHKIGGGEYMIREAKPFVLKNIFFAEKGKVDVRFAYPEKLKSCFVEVKDVKGRTLRKIDGKGGVAGLDFPARGYWNVVASAVYGDGGRIVTDCPVAVCGTPISHDLVRRSRYGMMVVLGGQDLWQKLGSRWDQRVCFAETFKNDFKFTNDTMDTVFTFHKEISPARLRRPEDRTRQGFFPPADWDEFRAFCGEWLDRQPLALTRRINVSGEADFQWRGTDAEYVKMARIFSEEAKKRNPGFVACGPAASRIKLPYYRRMHKEGFFDFIDAVSVHHYVDGTKPEAEYWEDVTNLFSFFEEVGIDKPVYITETGWSVGGDGYFVPVSYENQARYLTRTMTLLSSMPVKAIVWHVDFLMTDSFGAIRQRNEGALPKPMLQAFATVTRNLTDVKGDLKLRRLGPRTYLASGSKADGRWVHVWWRSAGEENVLPPVRALSAEDYLGTPVPFTGKMRVSEDPVYVFSDADYQGAEWTAPPGGTAPAVDPAVKTDHCAAWFSPGTKSTAEAVPFPAGMWSDSAAAPELKVAYGRDGLVFDITVKDTEHSQPFSQERLVEGDSITLAFDVDKDSEWRANDIWMTYKGHRAVEYSIARRDDGKNEVFRRNCWIPDMKRFSPAFSTVRANVRHSKGKTKYWVWVPWATLGLDEQLLPGARIGFAAELRMRDGGTVRSNRLFGGIGAQVGTSNTANPMKYGTVELSPKKEIAVKQVFRKERFTRGNVNLRKIQDIDDASWIWIDGGKWTAKERPIARFRRDFKGCGETLRIDVSGDARFVLLLDGKVIARGPHKGFNEHWYYQTYDIAGLGDGSHRMEAVVFDLGNAGPFSITTSGKRGFVLKASGKYDSALTTGKAQWRAAEVRGLEFGKLTDPETMTGVENLVYGTGFLGQDCRNWRKCVVVKPPVHDHGYGVSHRLWAMFPTERHDQISVMKSPGAVKASQFAYDETNICYTAEDGKRDWTGKFDAMVRRGVPVTVPPRTRIRFLWDMEDYYCGYPLLEASGGKGARIRWAWAECLYNARIVGDIHANRGNRNEFAGKTNHRSMYDTFFCDGRPDARFTVPWWKSGRWIELSVATADEPVTLKRMAIEESRYPAECEASFECDDPAIPSIFRMCVRGMQNCLHETFMDCPYFEQQMYPGDTRVEMLVSRTMFSDMRLIRHGIGLFDYARRNNGLVPMNFPSRGVQNSSTYSMCWVMMLGDYALWNGPDAFLRARIPGMRQTLSQIDMYSDGKGLLTGLPGWSFQDWVPEWDMYGNAPDGRYGKSALNNLLFIAALGSASAAEGAMGDAAMSAYWKSRAERLAKAVVAEFWSEERGMIADTVKKDRFSEHAQCLALLNDVLPGDKAERAFKGLLEAEDLARTTVYFSHYLFETFLKFGRADLVLKRFDLWRGFVADGMKTPIEAPGWRGRSECHAWGAHPMYHLLTGFAGIKPTAEGYSRVRIAPDPGGLKFIRAACPTPRGKVKVDLRFDAGEVSGTVTLPKGLPGEFVWKGKTSKLEEGVNKL